MNYRPEIDGLRALAVIPVIFFHTNLTLFSGGFIGVDIFFVISGYLITTIIFTEIEKGEFSIVNFYERRARRILPALFSVMLISSIVGFFWLMPDEFKNYGQSLVATTLFSNNILLALTSGYWSLASEFKPLLHTWSLGVEEQYYVIAPILLILFSRFGRKSILYLLLTVFVLSLSSAIWLVNASPDWAFYNLASRAWEICIGALAGFYLICNPEIASNHKPSNLISSIGFGLIIFSIFFFDTKVLSPSYLLLLPTVGSVLIIIFCHPNTFIFYILANKNVVFIGFLSYSLYLWHQPIFAFLRVYSAAPPNPIDFLEFFPVIFILSYFTWKFIEEPFREKTFIKKKNLFLISTIVSFLFITAGLALNSNYGMPFRVFGSDFSIADMDKRVYNEKIFSYKKNEFNKISRTKILIIGNSFARDFTNITLESFDISNVDIIYRDDISECIFSQINTDKISLFFEADAIIFASGQYDKNCIFKDISFALSKNKKIFYIGTKDFGYNLNWLIRLSKNERVNKFNVLPNDILNIEKESSKIIPRENFISLLAATLVDNKIPITDELGRMLSVDRKHLTKYGAIYFGRKAVIGTLYSELFN